MGGEASSLDPLPVSVCDTNNLPPSHFMWHQTTQCYNALSFHLILFYDRHVSNPFANLGQSSWTSQTGKTPKTNKNSRVATFTTTHLMTITWWESSSSKNSTTLEVFFVAMVLERIILVWTCIIPTHCTQTYDMLPQTIPAPSAQHAAVLKPKTATTSTSMRPQRSRTSKTCILGGSRLGLNDWKGRGRTIHIWWHKRTIRASRTCLLAPETCHKWLHKCDHHEDPHPFLSHPAPPLGSGLNCCRSPGLQASGAHLPAAEIGHCNVWCT